MTAILGLDIGTNSVGSAWIDLERKEVRVGVSVFPAGVDQTDERRGAPKNQVRRQKRSLRRSLARKSARKRKLRMFLVDHGLLPATHDELNTLFTSDPWQLRRKGLYEELTPHEFGRILLHLSQRRGALGLKMPEDDDTGEDTEDGESRKKAKKRSASTDPEGAVKAAVEATKLAMKQHEGVTTFGELMAIIAEQRRKLLYDKNGEPKKDRSGNPITYSGAIRNKEGEFDFHADRAMLRKEFDELWKKQSAFDSELAKLLTPDLRKCLDNPEGNRIWRHQGLLFGQRRTFWDAGSLGRCDLEPTDRCVPIADRHASYYRVLETVNNIRVRFPGDSDLRPLSAQQRGWVIDKLRTQKTGTIATIRKALKIDKTALKKSDHSEQDYTLNLERDENREINTDWFYRAVVVEALGQAVWDEFDESKKEELNRALLRFDPTLDDDASRLVAFATKLGLNAAVQERLLENWKRRPKLEKRLNLSRRAVRNLIPYMEASNDQGGWRTQIEARKAFAASIEERLPSSDVRKARQLTPDELVLERQYERYKLGGNCITKRDRHYLKKHAENVLPPAPMLSNPVVRKAIHEVRRHVIAHVRAHGGQKPDRIVIEFARETTMPAKVNDKLLARNRKREAIRRRIREEIIQPAWGSGFDSLSSNQLRAAEDRVILCIQQRGVCAFSLTKMNVADSGLCAYSGQPITLRQAALGSGLEVDHIIPRSRCGDNSLNNRVLCYCDSNRNKGNKTPREWWGDEFDMRIAPLKFMGSYNRDMKDDYFTVRDYDRKWQNLSCREAPMEWKGSQLSDTAYAAKEVQSYLQSLWPDEPTHLAEGATRRILVTKGAYTSLLRRDWQLYQSVWREGGTSPDEQQRESAKDRGDHREHAVDAVAIAAMGLPDRDILRELARSAKAQEESWAKAKANGAKPEQPKRSAILPPWGSVKSFRRQVLSLVYESFLDPDDTTSGSSPMSPIVVSHRPSGRKLTANFHEDTLFGTVTGEKSSFSGRKAVGDLNPNHLREPVAEKAEDAIRRLTQRYREQGLDDKQSKARAKAIVESPGYVKKLVNPPSEKSGIVRDSALRDRLRKVINQRLRALKIERTADTFTKQDMARILKETGDLTMESGVPIKRVVLLREMKEPVIIPRRKWDDVSRIWTVESVENDDGEILESLPSSARVYVGGNNHHVEIRESGKGKWTGMIVSAHAAAKLARIKKRNPVDTSDDSKRGGRYVMALSEGDTVYMRHKDSGEPGYFVVFKLVKPHTVEFKHHWDARRAKGEKDSFGNVIDKREAISVPVPQMKQLSPPGETTPIKVAVDPLGQVYRIEPAIRTSIDLAEIDPRVVAIAREALAAKNAQSADAVANGKRRRHGSWSWMRWRLERDKLAHLGPQLSAAIRILKGPN